MSVMSKLMTTAQDTATAKAAEREKAYRELVNKAADAEHTGRGSIDAAGTIEFLDEYDIDPGTFAADVARRVRELADTSTAAGLPAATRARKAVEAKLAAADAAFAEAKTAHSAAVHAAAEDGFEAIAAEAQTFLAAAAVCPPAGRPALAVAGRALITAIDAANKTCRRVAVGHLASPLNNIAGDESVNSRFTTMAQRLEYDLRRAVLAATEKLELWT